MNLQVQEWAELGFNLLYLVVIYLLVVKMSLKLPKSGKAGDRAGKLGKSGDGAGFLRLFRNTFLLLALGDTGHVGFRVIAYLSGGLEKNATFIGIGALCTAITVTFVYMGILEMWRRRFAQERGILYWCLMATGIVRLVLLVLPWNEWSSVVPPLAPSLVRNIPLMIQGLFVAVLMLRSSLAAKDGVFTALACCIFASFLFYTPVILFVRIVPAIGALMIPKTIAYVAMAWIGYAKLFPGDPLAKNELCPRSSYRSIFSGMEKPVTRPATERDRIKATIEEAKASRAVARVAMRGTLSGKTKRLAVFKKVFAAIVILNVFFLAFPPFLVPVEGRVSSPFFFRFAPDRTLPVLEFHDAIDIAVPAGTPVRSMAPGVVESVGYDNAAGNYVTVRHLLGMRSFYGHLQAVSVKKGKLILFPFFARIGRSGSTGRSTGPHLHFGVRLGRLPVPPDPLFVWHRIRLGLLGF